MSEDGTEQDNNPNPDENLTGTAGDTGGENPADNTGEIAALATQSVGDIKKSLAGLSDADLETLAVAERASRQREGVFKAIAAEQKKRAPDAPPAAKKTAKAETPAWQDKDYNGPLTGEQALWRNANITRES